MVNVRAGEELNNLRKIAAGLYNLGDNLIAYFLERIYRKSSTIPLGMFCQDHKLTLRQFMIQVDRHMRSKGVLKPRVHLPSEPRRVQRSQREMVTLCTRASTLRVL